MYVSEQLIEFIEFLLIGIIIAIIFDFFRAYRKVKNVSFIVLALQDVLYFAIATIILIFGIIYLLSSNIRLYIYIAIFLGAFIYITFLSKYILKIYILLFKFINGLIKFLISPILLNIQVIINIYKFFKKNIKKCCKKFSYMVLNIYNLVKVIFRKKNAKN